MHKLTTLSTFDIPGKYSFFGEIKIFIHSYPQVIHNMWIFLGKNKVDEMPVDNFKKFF